MHAPTNLQMRQWIAARDHRALWVYVGIISFFCGIAAVRIPAVEEQALALSLTLAIAGGCIVAVEFLSRQKCHGAAFFIALSLLSLGIMRAATFSAAVPEELGQFDGRSASIVGTVAADPDRRQMTLHATLEVSSVAGSPVAGRVLLIAERATDLSFGDTVRAVGILERPEPFGTAGRMFDWGEYLRKDGIVMVMRPRQIEIVAEGDPSVRGTLFALKHTLESSIERTLEEPRAGLLQGLLLGNRDALAETLKNDFITAGLIHVVVLSGYNMSLVADLFMRALARLPRAVRLGVGAGAIIAFAVMVGAGATVVRAAIMALIVILARALRRPQVLMRGLLVAGFLMVFHNPLILTSDPSFILSFLATFGLITVGPFLEGKLTFIPEHFALRGIVAATLATQAFVLPALLYLTGNLSLVALPANVLALPAVPYAMFFGFLAAALSLLHFVAALPATLIASGLLSLIVAVAQGSSAIPGASFTVPPFPLWAAFAAYAVLTPLALFLLTQTKSPAVQREIVGRI